MPDVAPLAHFVVSVPDGVGLCAPRSGVKAARETTRTQARTQEPHAACASSSATSQHGFRLGPRIGAAQTLLRPSPSTPLTTIALDNSLVCHCSCSPYHCPLVLSAVLLRLRPAATYPLLPCPSIALISANLHLLDIADGRTGYTPVTRLESNCVSPGVGQLHGNFPEAQERASEILRDRARPTSLSYQARASILIRRPKRTPRKLPVPHTGRVDLIWLRQFAAESRSATIDHDHGRRQFRASLAPRCTVFGLITAPPSLPRRPPRQA